MDSQRVKNLPIFARGYPQTAPHNLVSLYVYTTLDRGTYLGSIGYGTMYAGS